MITAYNILSHSESDDKVDVGATRTTDSSGSNNSDGMATPCNETRQSPVHFLLPMLTPKTPSSGDFTQL